MSLMLLFVWALWVEEEPYILVMANNTQMQVMGPPECEGKLCKVVLPNGQVSSLPARMIDREKTRMLNQRLADERAEADRLAEETAQQLAEQEAAEVAKRKPIELNRKERLPETDQTANRTSGTVLANPAADTGGEARVRNFTSEDPLYIAEERMVTLPDGYRLECRLRTNTRDRVQNVVITLKVNFSDSPAQTFTKRSPDLAGGDSATIVFEVPGTENILQTSYDINYETVGEEPPP